MDAFLTCFEFVRVNHRHVIRKGNRWKIPEHIATDFYIFMLYFMSSLLLNARTDTYAEKKFDIVIQMTLERVLVERFKKREVGEKK